MELVELKNKIYGLGLCAGIGGMELGLKRALGERYRTVCLVEKNAFCASTLVARMENKALDSAPIWDDIESFDGTKFSGKVDIISAGFPCQPFSTASRGRKTAKDLWPEVLRITKEIRPNFGFIENVQKNPITQAARDLAAIGYESIFMQLSAAEMGAPFIRKRWWLLAHFDCHSESARTLYDEAQIVSAPEKTSYWEYFPSEILGVGDGVSDQLDKLERYGALGNAVVPIVAANAFRILMRSL